MNKKVILTLVLLMTFASWTYGYTERDLLQKAASLEQLKSALIPSRKWVRYPDYADRSGWDALMGENRAFFISEGEKYLDYEWKVVKATEHLEFARSSSSSQVEPSYGSNIQALYALFLAEMAEGMGRFIDPVIDGVFAFCEMTSWAIRAHLSAQRVGGSFPKVDDHVIELVSGDIGAALSWIHYFLHERFDKENPLIAERLRYEIERRILAPYLAENRFWWIAANLSAESGGSVNNWNPWCNGAVLQCFLLMENDPERLAKAVYKTMWSVDKFINSNHDDGACEEGPSYWGNAAGKLYGYLRILCDATGGKVDIFNNQLIKNMGEYIARSYIGDGWVVNFADASAKGGGDAQLIYRYGKDVGSTVMTSYAGYLRHIAGRLSPDAGRDLFRTFENLTHWDEMKQLPTEFKNPPFTWYPQTEFCYMSSSQGFFLGAKGGFNNESHNHNDVGTFLLFLNRTPIFIDAGVGAYTRKTFSNERYTIWSMQSNYHNLPMINGVAQPYGAQYRAKNSSFDSRRMTFSTDIAGAYPPEACVKTWLRSYKVGKTVRIEDRFTLTKSVAPNLINFLTSGQVDISTPGKIIIGIDGEKVSMSYDKSAFEAKVETVTIDADSPKVWGEAVYRITLVALKNSLSGTYIYTIQSL
ncbi:MAG: heparinase II/III-family protein [Tannerella sp.]|jgi:hypothetical protein|nr:heparinase II/III-family protein [Tannerella sp.]